MEGAGGFGAAEQAEDDLGPTGIVEFEGHAGEDQEEKAGDDQEMEEALIGRKTGEPLIAFLGFDLGFAECFRVVRPEVAGAEEPQAGVGAEEEEDADQQAGHGDEGVVDLGIVFGVERIGVGKVLGEIGVGTGMAFLAGGDDVGLGKMGGGIGRGQHIVMAVAVVAGRDFRGEVGLAQQHGLAVVGIAIMFEPVLVATAAFFVAGSLEISAVRLGDFMGGMAIHTDGSVLAALGQNLAVDAGLVGFLDAEVAFAAGGGDIGVVDGGTAVHAAPDVMGAVAIVAGRGDDQSHFHQGAPVDAVGVLAGHLGILHPVLGGEAGIVVASGAGEGEIELEDGRIGVFDRNDVVGAVAVGAAGGGGGAAGLAHAVDAGGVLGVLGGMAGGALGRGQTGRMDQVLDGVVAVGAVEAGVNGFLKGVGVKEGEGHGFPGDGARGVGIAVALQAIRVGNGVGGEAARRHQGQKGQRPKGVAGGSISRRYGSRCIGKLDHIRQADGRTSALEH